MFDFTLNNNPNVTKLHIGNEQTPLLIIDDFANQPADFISFAGDGARFKADRKNYYPGKRLLTPNIYNEQLCRKYISLLKSTFGFDDACCAKTLFSALAISDLAPKQLKPMQMLPHFDTTHDNQIAVVHYLSSAEHGGTSFYQHRSSKFETITEQRLVSYGRQLKKEAMANQIHKAPSYMNGSNAMFERIHAVEAKINRAVIYPSNLLHSGDINPLHGLSSKPLNGRLTIGSLISVV